MITNIQGVTRRSPHGLQATAQLKLKQEGWVVDVLAMKRSNGLVMTTAMVKQVQGGMSTWAWGWPNDALKSSRAARCTEKYLLEQLASVQVDLAKYQAWLDNHLKGET